MNQSPPYEIAPDDINKVMLQANVAPTYDQLSALIGEGKVITVRDENFFDQRQVDDLASMDKKALVLMAKLKAPDLCYHLDVIDIFNRLWNHAWTNANEEVRTAILKDDPEFDFSDEARLALVCRTTTSAAVMARGMADCHQYSAVFISLRIKHGVDVGVHSAVTAIRDVNAAGDIISSLISVHGVENNLGDERLYVDLYRPN